MKLPLLFSGRSVHRGGDVYATASKPTATAPTRPVKPALLPLTAAPVKVDGAAEEAAEAAASVELGASVVLAGALLLVSAETVVGEAVAEVEAADDALLAAEEMELATDEAADVAAGAEAELARLDGSGRSKVTPYAWQRLTAKSSVAVSIKSVYCALVWPDM